MSALLTVDMLQALVSPSSGCARLRVRADLLRADVCVCSTSVLAAFTDNFDFADLDDFVQHSLAHEDVQHPSFVGLLDCFQSQLILAFLPVSLLRYSLFISIQTAESKIYLHLLEDEYFTRVNNLELYDIAWYVYVLFVKKTKKIPA